jgi:H+/Cl- antiporter ClcA
LKISGIFTQERINAFIMALILIGVVLVTISVVRFVSASQQLDGNLAQQMQSGEIPVNPETPEETQGLIASDIERRRLSGERNEALIMGGAGLGLLAVGWLGYDFARGRRKSRPEQATEAVSSTAE